ncbi:MAG: CoB--CoM heterodisulfide reductase iron-sulfur subunit B family protein [Candidatus Jordarchaeales archaeon]|nr:CoB--CoM heterodisulfide reductase subunit B [Candidatus Jordarchaeia archaeon]
MTGYSLFPGCLIPLRFPFLEASSRLVLNALGVRYEALDGASCCPDPVGVQSVNFKAWLYLAARNLALAEEKRRDVLTLCSGCFETLKTAREILLQSPPLMDEVNEALKLVDKEFKGSVDVVHIIEALYRVRGKIKEMVSTELDADAAVHYGCHLLRPSDYLKFDDSENPTKMDELVEALGARSVDYNYKHLCCGAAMSNIKRELTYPYVKWKLSSVARSGAECMVVACPFCFMQYDLGQVELSRKGEAFSIPVFYYPEMLGLALGYSYRELGLHMHKTSVTPFIRKHFL